MSVSPQGLTNRGKNGGKPSARLSVRFAEDEGGRRKRPRIERPNEDEQDDVEEWIDDEEHIGASSKELHQAKLSRRLQREHVNDEDSHGDAEEEEDLSTSLAATKDQEVPVEPFNLRAERTDGSGYFEGDTYVFRKREEEEEPDAWVESLGENDETVTIQKQMQQNEKEESMNEWTREDLYANIIPLVSDTETILQALVRYGELIKRKDNTISMAQEALNSLTEASNALLLKGDVDIYQKTRQDLMQLVPSQRQQPKRVVYWQYRGNQDGGLHGPYATQQMQSWIGAGYFTGEQAVQIRTVTTQDKEKEKGKVDDLLSDLLEEEEEDDSKKESTTYGKWMSSGDVDFSNYA